MSGFDFEEWLEKCSGKVKGVFITIAILFALAIMFRVMFVTFVDNYEFGFTYDRFAGKIEILNRTGYIVRMPFMYSVHSIDLRPYQISITANIGSTGQATSVASRVLNAKLVKFNPAGLNDFIAWHGRDAGDKIDNLLEIMKCYAFDIEGGKDCPFIIVLSEINPSQASVADGAPADHGVKQ